MRASVAGIALLALALLAGCGDDGGPGSEQASSETTSPAAIQEIGLEEACSRVQAALDVDELDATADDWEAAAAALDEIEKEGGAEVDLLVSKVDIAVQEYLAYTSAGSPPGEGGDAFDALTDAGQAISETCG